MNTRLISGALAALLTTVSGAALAQDAPPPPHRHGGGLLMRADTNRDDIVTRDEMLAAVDTRFARIDANRDGRITADERHDRGRMAGRRMRGQDGVQRNPDSARRSPHADTNHDGATTRDEQRALALKIFNYIDRNHDGRIDQAERQEFREVAMALAGPRARGEHGRHGWRHGRHGPPPAGAPEAPRGQ